MKQFFTILLSAILSVATANAQSFLDRLQTQTKGKGSVTVTQSADIDRLVNGTTSGTAAVAVQKKPTESKPASVSGANTSAGQVKTAEKPIQHHTSAKAETNSPKTETGTTTETEVRTADPRPKVMGNSYKVNGYRVQAFAGSNTRADKQKAQRIGNAIKDIYPNEPVYVHFYSPRWICRIGNYRTYEEAHKMLLELRELGYKQAIIVKGKITVQY